MPRLPVLQHWCNVSDPGLEEDLLASTSMRRFVGIDLGVERVPDETTVCKFRHLLQRHGLGKQIFKRVNEHLRDRGFMLSPGTIVDATLISAPTSTQNGSCARDPELGTTKKDEPWPHGMKARIGVDDKTKLLHAVKATPGNSADATMRRHLLHGRERRVWGECGARVGRQGRLRPGSSDQGSRTQGSGPHPAQEQRQPQADPTARDGQRHPLQDPGQARALLRRHQVHLRLQEGALAGGALSEAGPERQPADDGRSAVQPVQGEAQARPRPGLGTKAPSRGPPRGQTSTPTGPSMCQHAATRA